MKQEAYLHDVDLGSRMEPAAEKVVLRLNNEGLRAVLHRLRDQAATMDRMGRQTPDSVGANPLEWRAYHAGAADALEEVFWKLWWDMEGEEGGDLRPET